MNSECFRQVTSILLVHDLETWASSVFGVLEPQRGDVNVWPHLSRFGEFIPHN